MQLRSFLWGHAVRLGGALKAIEDLHRLVGISIQVMRDDQAEP